MVDEAPIELEAFDELAKAGGKGKKKKGSKILFILIGFIFLMAGAFFVWFQMAKNGPEIEKVDTQDVAQASTEVKNTGSKTDSEVYRKANREEEFERAEEAGARNGSVIPRLMEDESDPLPEAPKKEPEPEPAPVPEPVQETPPPPAPRIIEYESPVANGEGYDRWLNGNPYTPGTLTVSNIQRTRPEISDSANTGNTVSSDSGKTGENGENPPELEVVPGDILYAVMELGANSDQPGTPVMARVVSGQWAGAKFIGGFMRMDEKMVIQFNRAVIKDKRGRSKTYSVSGYAVDPNTYSPGVRSSVDTHFWERWGGLIASSFLEGFGEAKSRSGTTYYYGNDNNPGQFSVDYDVADEIWIAAGKVGEKASEKFADNFNREPTVTIEPGLAIGILLL